MDAAPSSPAGRERPPALGPAVPPPGLPFRRPVLVSLGRAAVNLTALLLLYYVLPLNRQLSWRTVGWLLGGLVLVGLLVAAQIRSVLRARYPGLRALEALATSVPLFLLVFAAVYEMLDAGAPGSFSEAMTRTDSLYFVVTVFATVGFGDITPVSETARVLVTVQMVGDLVLIGLVVRAFLTAAERGRRRRQDEQADGTGHRGR